MTSLNDLMTPCLLINKKQLHENIERMQNKIFSSSEGITTLRPHIKTTKCLQILQIQQSYMTQKKSEEEISTTTTLNLNNSTIDSSTLPIPPNTSLTITSTTANQNNNYGITVSTIKEAEEFFKFGYNNILYAVAISPQKLKYIENLMKRGCNIQIITDSLATSTIIRKYGENNNIIFNVLIEIDTDDHRAGIKPESQLLLDVANELTHNNNDGSGGAHLIGVMTHAGGSYDCTTTESLVEIAEKERSGCVYAAKKLRINGYSCPIVSIGSTPTALSALHFDDVTEVRAGVYVFQDLVMYHIGVCCLSEIALSVLTTVIGHQVEKNWVIIDAGWMAMSRDLGLSKSSKPYLHGYGRVIPANEDNENDKINQLHFISTNQEHGVLQYTPSISNNNENDSISIVERFPVGTLFRILPNHACATAAQYSEYHVIERKEENQNEWIVTETWNRFNGW